MAHPLLVLARMASEPKQSWTVPLHILMWTVLSVGFIMVLVVFMLH